MDKSLSKRIDFFGVIIAEDCNPNGDPAALNRPRIDFEGHGEMSPDCIKRKIRNRLQDMGENIFVKQRDRSDDGCASLRDRAVMAFGKKMTEENAKDACEKWIDVRCFGQVFAFKGDGVSVGIRGPVSVTTAKSIDIVNVIDIDLARSVNTTTVEDGKKDRASLIRRPKIDHGAYAFKGGIYPNLAVKTGMTDEDAEKIKRAIMTLFENDASSVRPSGSMTMGHLIWWTHPSNTSRYAPARVFRSVDITPEDQWPYYDLKIKYLDGLKTEVYDLIGDDWCAEKA